MVLWQYYASDHVLAESSRRFTGHPHPVPRRRGRGRVGREGVRGVLPRGADRGRRQWIKRSHGGARAGGRRRGGRGAPPRQGRAIVTAFGLLDEELVIMVDGDGSYPAEGARRLLAAWRDDRADMITGIRVPEGDAEVFRPFHQAGSAAFAAVFRLVFHYEPGDLFSGLRLFSKRFYKNVPLLFRGFELETELTVQAVEKGFRAGGGRDPVPCPRRGWGSRSCRTLRDGLRHPAPRGRPLPRLSAPGLLRRDRGALPRGRPRSPGRCPSTSTTARAWWGDFRWRFWPPS